MTSQVKPVGVALSSAHLTALLTHRDQPYDLARRVASASQRSGGRAGLVLGLREFIAYVLPELAGSGVIRTGWSGTLRERLSRPAAPPLPARSAAASAERVVVRVDHQLHPVP